MLLNYIHKLGWLVGLVLLQVLILNNVHIGGYATPFLYIYLILKFSSNTPRNELMIWAFVAGLSVDMFSDTPGMNAAASVLLAFVRPAILPLFSSRDMVEGIEPGFRSMGTGGFLKYAALCVLVHHVVLLSLEYFSFVHIGALVLHIVSSMALTTICLMAIEGICRKQ